MRSLTLNEMHSVTGAGFAEDITAVAATLYVAKNVAAVGVAAGSALVTPLMAMETLGPLAMVLATATPFITVMAPFVVIASVVSANPDLQAGLEANYHQYFR